MIKHNKCNRKSTKCIPRIVFASVHVELKVVRMRTSFDRIWICLTATKIRNAKILHFGNAGPKFKLLTIVSRTDHDEYCAFELSIFYCLFRWKWVHVRLRKNIHYLNFDSFDTSCVRGRCRVCVNGVLWAACVIVGTGSVTRLIRGKCIYCRKKHYIFSFRINFLSFLLLWFWPVNARCPHWITLC